MMTAADAQAMLRDWGELGVYVPRTGARRNIWLIVDRNAPQPIGESQAVMRPILRATVANAATAVEDDGFGGIASHEVDTGGDKVEVPVRIGATAKSLPVRQILNEDEAMMTVEIG